MRSTLARGLVLVMMACLAAVAQPQAASADPEWQLPPDLSNPYWHCRDSRPVDGLIVYGCVVVLLDGRVTAAVYVHNRFGFPVYIEAESVRLYQYSQQIYNRHCYSTRFVHGAARVCVGPYTLRACSKVQARGQIWADTGQRIGDSWESPVVNTPGCTSDPPN